jgi:putative inorganic carbon (hco3(-)) transporter
MSDRRRAKARGGRHPAQAATEEPFPFPHPLEQWFLWLAVVVAGLLVTPETSELFFLGRTTVLLVLAGGLLATIVVTSFETKRPGIEWSAAAWAALALLVTMAVAVAVAADRDQALLGPYSRYTGLFPHLAYTVFFLGLLRQRMEGFVRSVVLISAAVATIPIVYGALQGAGLDPVTWTGAELSTVFATFGQTNFAAGYVAVVVPLLVFVAADRCLPAGVRIGASVAIALAVYFLYEAQSFQGPVALVVGVAPPAVVILRRQFPTLTPRRLLLFSGTGVLLIALVILLVPTLRETVDKNLEDGFQERLLMWDAAGDMARDDPILGKGLGGYTTEFSRYRPVDHVRIYESRLADAPHSVPLRMLSEGGVVLFSAYMSFVIATGVALLYALRRRRDLLTASVGGAWLAYQVQSLVSFDVPSLAIMHWLLAGAIVLLAGTSHAAPVHRRNQRRTIAWHPVAAAVAVMVVITVPASIPLRADVAVENAGEFLNDRSVTEARNELQRATRIAPWEGLYWARLANVQRRLGRNDLALVAGIRAAEESPGAAQYARGAGQLAAVLGRDELAARWYEEAIARDPRNAAVLAEVAKWHLMAGRPDKAVALLERADALAPGEYAAELRAARRAATSSRTERAEP